MNDLSDLAPLEDDDAHDVRSALRTVAAWYGPAGDPAVAEPAVPTDRPAAEPDLDAEVGLGEVASPTGWSRTILVAAVAAVVLGWVGLAVAGRGSGGTADTVASTVVAAPGGAVVGPSDARILELCLDVDTDLDVGRLATTGDLHRFGEPPTGGLDVVIADDGLHVTCALGRRDTEWFQVTAIAAANSAAPGPDGVVVDQRIDLGDRFAIGGRRGGDIDSITIKVGADIHPAATSGEWWLATFPDTDDSRQFPDHNVRWTYQDNVFEATAEELEAAAAWSLCAEDDECRANRIAELTELANALDDLGQAALLADGVVTEAERVSAMRAWGTCIADETGSSVDFDSDGTFYVFDEDIPDEVWSGCYRRHAEYAVQVADYLDAAG